MPCRSATSARYAREHDVGSPRELVDDGPAFVGRHVEGDALLALERLDRADLGEGQDRAERISVERLDLDHPGAEVGEECRAERSRVVPAELEHGHAVERRVRGRALAVVRVGARARSRRPPVRSQRAAMFVDGRRGPFDVRRRAVHSHHRGRLAHLSALARRRGAGPGGRTASAGGRGARGRDGSSRPTRRGRRRRPAATPRTSSDVRPRSSAPTSPRVCRRPRTRVPRSTSGRRTSSRARGRAGRRGRGAATSARTASSGRRPTGARGAGSRNRSRGCHVRRTGERA